MDFALKRCAVASGALAYGPRSALRVEQALLAANVRALRAGRPTLTSRLGPRSPAAPSLRSGKPWGQARGQVHAGLEASAKAALHHALPDRGRGRGLDRPPDFGTAAWGRFRLGPHASPAPPVSALPGVGAGQPLRLDAFVSLAGALRAGALRVPVARFSGLGALAGFAPPSHGLGS